MGRGAELWRRRPSTLAALHVLTVQRCAAAFLAILSYGAILWIVYTVWLRDVSPEEDRRPGPSTLPVDYQTYRTSERAREAYRAAEYTSEVHGASEEGHAMSSARFRSTVPGGASFGGDSVDTVGYRTDEAAEGDANGYRDATNAESEDDFEDNLVEGFDEEEEEDNFDDSDEGEEDEDEEDTEQPPNRRLLVFNSVPHTGSEVITLLLRWLGKQNNFEYIQLRTERSGPLELPEQKRLVQKMTGLSDSQKDGGCVSHSSYVMDFSQLGAALPLRFSMIRDPIDRLMARFTHDRVLGGFSPPPGAAAADWPLTLKDCLRTAGAECTYMNGQQYPELAVPFFCGHHTECTRHNSRWALERAKRTVERQFVTVGVLEDMNTTLAVAETLLPRYFSGAWDTFFIDLVGQIGDFMIPRAHDELSREARDRLRANLTTEYEFYEFVRQRVEQQYNAFVPGS